VRLVVITQRVDPDDQALGATVAMLRALAERVDELVVLTLSARDASLPANVRVRELRASSQLMRGAELTALLAPELRRRPVAVLAHMAPIYAVLAAPLARPLGVPVLLWFTHWRASRLLRVAERMSTRVLTVDRTSFPLSSSKIVPLGHAIDVEAFSEVADAPGEATLKLLALGRTSPAKGLTTMLRAVAELDDLAVSLEIRGPSLTDEERAHRAALQRLVADEGLSDRVSISEPLDRSDIVELYGRIDALVNNMRAGALDKVVYEAAAAARPVLVANPGFESLVGGLEPPLRFSQDDAGELASRIRALHDSGPEARRSLGRELSERVRRGHSVEHWADGVIAAISK
jgi:glycosyltransferase involved in cell wall biosynthesis